MHELWQAGLSNAVGAAFLAMVALVVTRVWKNHYLAYGLWLIVLVKLISPAVWSVPMPAWFQAETETQIAEDRSTNTASSADSPPVRKRSFDETKLQTPPPSTTERGDDQKMVAAVSPQHESTRASSVPPETIAGVGKNPPASKPHARVQSDPTLLSHHPAESRASVFWDRLPATLTLFGWVWSCGSCIWATVVVYRIVRFHRLVQRTQPAPDWTQDCAAALSKQLGLRRCPEIRQVDANIVPMVWPLGRRIVLLPKQLLDGLPEDQTATIIAHELAHIRRRDDLLRFFELFVLCLYWWNPIQWWARRELHAAEEACCDALVLRTLPGGVCDYGEALLRTGQFVSAGLSSPALATGFGRTSSLKRRVEMILANRFSKPASGLQKLVMLGVAAAVLPLGGQAISDDGPTTDAVSDAQPKATDQKTDRGSEPLKSGGGRRRGSATVAKTPTSPAPAIHETAQLMASQQVSLYAKVAGFVRTIHADLGDRVQKGQVLAELDAPEMEAEVQRLRTMASKSIAELERHRAELARTQASRIELETQLQKHKAEFNRLKAMSDKGIATNAKVEEAQFALEAAYATHKTQDAVIAAAEAQAAAARADVDVAGAELRKAEAMLSYLQIRAPFEGIISSRSAVVGSLAQPPSQKRDAALFELVAVDPIRVVCHVSADAAARVTKGTPAFVRVRGDDGQGVAAKIARLGATLEPVSRSLRVEIDLPNPGEKLRPGMWAAVVIPTPAAADSGTVDRAEPARRPRAGGQTGIEGLAVSPDSKVVAVVVGAGRSMFELELWDIARGGVLSKTEVQGSASSVEFSSDGTRVAVFSSDAKRVRIFNVPTGEALERTSAKQWALRQATPPVGESPEP